ncbi:hypothetical protein ACFORO_42630 [Amycolatopsis halotolerans]|uniref:Metallophosphoesterase n=1 Tax=Amycolatopsis halotolerans TaxID=330083 RepID=A0ABV7QWU2_9PSEU
MSDTTTVVVPDAQIPYHNRKALRALIGFIGDFQPSAVVNIGDLADFPQPSRWNKDTRGEFEGSVYRDAEIVARDWSEPLREVYSGPVGIHEGNHDERPRVYLEKYAPALSGTKAFHMETLLSFDAYEFTRLPEFHDIAPGWLSTHGHRGGIRLTQVSGMTAFKAAERFGRSVIMGHTHRLGKVSKSYGYAGEIKKTLTGVEVGNVMDMKRANYLKGATANWQSGFAIVRAAKKSVQVDTIEITGGRFQVDGVSYQVS